MVCLITICKAELLAVPKSHPHLPSRPPILACLWPSDVSVLLNVTHHPWPRVAPLTLLFRLTVGGSPGIFFRKLGVSNFYHFSIANVLKT